MEIRDCESEDMQPLFSYKKSLSKKKWRIAKKCGKMIE